MDHSTKPTSPPAEIEHEPQGTEHTRDIVILAVVFWGLMALLIVTQYLRS